MTEQPAERLAMTMREFNTERRRRRCGPACTERHTHTAPCQLTPDGARTTPDNPATSGDHVCGNCDGVDPGSCLANPAQKTSPKGDSKDALREQYAAAIRPTMLMGLQDAELFDEPGRERINEWVDWIAKQVATVRDGRIEELAAELAALKEISGGYCPHCGRGDCSPTADQWSEQRKRADAAEAAIHQGLYVAEVIDANGITWAADSIRRALNPQEQP